MPEITIEPSTVYNFDVGWLPYYTDVMLLIVVLLCMAVIVVMIFLEWPTVPAVCLTTALFIMFIVSVVIDQVYAPNEQREERITAQLTQHHNEIDNAVQDWLDDYDIELTELCQSTYSKQNRNSSVVIHPLDAEETVVCGTGTQDSIHIVDNEHIVQATLTKHGKLQLSMVMR